MRSLKELLEIVLLRLEEEGKIQYGLCVLIMRLTETNIITREECNLLNNLIWKYVKGMYLFPIVDYDSRVEWLKERIKELEKEVDD